MAGIGFELRKMLNRNSILLSTGGYFYATFISVGPLLICISFLLTVRVVLRSMGLAMLDQNLLLAGITYSFTGSIFLSGIFAMNISRYISDLIYQEQEEKIFPSFITMMGLNVLVCGIGGFIFFVIHATVPIFFEILCYILLQALAACFLAMIYVSAIKNYRKITMSFIIGTALGIALIEVLILIFKYNVMYSILIGMDVGFTITAILLIVNVYHHFKIYDDSYFDVFKYFKKFPSLIFINVFYLASIFGHNIIIWTTELGINIMDSYYVAPLYDVPTFFALLSAMPSMVIFVIKTETTFYDYYRDYMKMLAGGGTLKDLNHAAESLREHMYNEIIALLQIQLMITALCIVLSRFLFPTMGFSNTQFAFFGFLALAYFCIMGVHVISTIMLYFDDKKSAVMIMTFFFVIHMIAVLISVQIGVNVYGLGSTVAGILSLIYAFIKLKQMVNSLNYRLYCSQPIMRDE